ncbi:molybdate ABC transporter substrate-binding protein [Jannaschia sp. W003]|uniref:molybdate ABC transporter substrate-binding protein n=1 Tax=Jannaschia sp. W003 TaxID=2867012 RepID=UPI0021A37218|nr:molybdate ABC transporter substrate-binding protein [Jannaschia sp. W003]UWQ20837.1 molybdate ABC transporter substrate-binding protein [Jannaschia sp. W003]
MATPFRCSRRRALLGAAALVAAPALVRAAAPLRVFAAASLKAPLDEIAPEAALSFAGSGAVARQVAFGAPADVVILAASDWMAWLHARGAVGPSRVVARNALVMAGPPGAAPLALRRDAVVERLGAGRFAVGDPMSVPAGRYAQQALETLGLWDAVSARLVLAENVRAALAYVARGDVALGAVYLSDALGAAVATVATFPAASHAPIVYPAALTRRAAPGAEALLERIAASGAVFARHGFAPA